MVGNVITQNELDRINRVRQEKNLPVLNQAEVSEIAKSCPPDQLVAKLESGEGASSGAEQSYDEGSQQPA